jgi:Zn-dependent protease with chaperone function
MVRSRASRCIVAAVLAAAIGLGGPAAAAQGVRDGSAPAAGTAAASSADHPGETARSDRGSARPAIRYTLPPDRYQKARSMALVRFWGTLLDFLWGVGALWLILRSKWSAKYRDWAERASRRRFVQACVFAPLLVLTIEVLRFPFAVLRNLIMVRYGLSVQGWGAWFWDWVKGELVVVLLATIVVWVLYAVIRRSPRRWWLYFWLASLPIGLAVTFLQPLVMEPLFFKFEPLAQKAPALAAGLQRMVQRAGQDIPPERMFWMGAREKLTYINAYVSGFGASKRIVVWDTTIEKMPAPQIVFVVGHEMGHFVLRHIAKFLGVVAVLLFALFYLGHRTIDWLLARKGAAWGVRGVDDWASLPALLLLMSVFLFCVTPGLNALIRRYERQADQYGLEVTRGVTPDAGRVCAHAFQAIGDSDLSDPEPNSIMVFLNDDHPPIPERMQFCLQGELVP